jgi:hypothetical protein
MRAQEDGVDLARARVVEVDRDRLSLARRQEQLVLAVPRAGWKLGGLRAGGGLRGRAAGDDRAQQGGRPENAEPRRGEQQPATPRAPWPAVKLPLSVEALLTRQADLLRLSPLIRRMASAVMGTSGEEAPLIRRISRLQIVLAQLLERPAQER